MGYWLLKIGQLVEPALAIGRRVRHLNWPILVNRARRLIDPVAVIRRTRRIQRLTLIARGHQ